MMMMIPDGISGLDCLAELMDRNIWQQDNSFREGFQEFGLRTKASELQQVCKDHRAVYIRLIRQVHVQTKTSLIASCYQDSRGCLCHPSSLHLQLITYCKSLSTMNISSQCVLQFTIHLPYKCNSAGLQAQFPTADCAVDLNHFCLRRISEFVSICNIHSLLVLYSFLQTLVEQDRKELHGSSERMRIIFIYCIFLNKS